MVPKKFLNDVTKKVQRTVCLNQESNRFLDQDALIKGLKRMP